MIVQTVVKSTKDKETRESWERVFIFSSVIYFFNLKSSVEKAEIGNEKTLFPKIFVIQVPLLFEKYLILMINIIRCCMLSVAIR